MGSMAVRGSLSGIDVHCSVGGQLCALSYHFWYAGGPSQDGAVKLRLVKDHRHSTNDMMRRVSINDNAWSMTL
jgi:hypothetical protein